ncbi:MAG: hypothetical protein HY208_08270 [Nitrospirae bacterium]|nr:hypothetical protein [Nitrospirota bacterium]
MGFGRLSRRLIGGTVLFVTLAVMPGWCTPAWAGVEFAPVLRVASSSPFGGTVGQLAGPIFFYDRRPSRLEWGVRPLFSSLRNDETGYGEFDLLYPLVTYHRRPVGTDGQVLQLFSWSTATHAGNPSGFGLKISPLLPLFFYESGPPGEPSEVSVFPLYGSLHHVLWNDRIDYLLFPLWLSLERDQIARRFVLWPFFGWATAASESAPPAHGWRFWPLYGELIQEGIKEERFVLWPFFIQQRLHLNTDEHVERIIIFPFYNSSQTADETSSWWSWPAFWPISFGHVVNTKTHYEEWALPWPLIQFGSGDEKRIRRVFPFYSEEFRTRTVDLLGKTQSVKTSSRIILWPLYHSTSEIGPDWRRDRDRLLLLLYSDVRTQQANKSDGRRIDLWPLFTYNKTPDGIVRFQTLAPIEPFLNTEPITRNYSPLWSLATYNRNPDAAEFSLLWGLFRWTATEREQRLRFFFLPSIHWTRSEPPQPDAAPGPSTDAPAGRGDPADPIGRTP